jgi:hypothetical protein
MFCTLTDSRALLLAYEVLYLSKISLQVVTGRNKIHDIGSFWIAGQEISHLF